MLRPGADGRLAWQPPAAGLNVASVTVAPREVDYRPEQIGIILEEYHIEGAAAAAVRALPKSEPLRVTSRRFAKSLVCAGDCADRSAATSPAKLDLEFVAADPQLSRFRLLSRGKPLPDHPIALARAGRRDHLRTDRSGTVGLPPEAKGAVMIFAAELSPPPGPDGRFELRLSSLTFER